MSSFVIFKDNCFSYANSLVKKNIVLFSMRASYGCCFGAIACKAEGSDLRVHFKVL